MAEKRNPKLHELIAVRGSIRTQMVKVIADLTNTFEKKPHHFTARIKSFIPKGEEAAAKVEEHLELQTTIRKELAWIQSYLIKAIDISHAVNIGNTQAQADIILEDGAILALKVPATTLLELEDFLEEIRKFASHIPTLDPAKGFHPDSNASDGTYVAREVEKIRTQATKKVYVLYSATKEHPAQTQLVDEQVPIGTIREQEWSAMMTPAQKGNLLDRIEKLIRAVKQARSRANETEVMGPTKIGGLLLSYIFGQ